MEGWADLVAGVFDELGLDQPVVVAASMGGYLTFELIRPKEVHLVGYDLHGAEVSIEADEILARCFQHELDHLDGVLFIERLSDDDRKAAMRIIRERRLSAADLAAADVATPAPKAGGFSLR